jgi:hypothetical protein
MEFITDLDSTNASIKLTANEINGLRVTFDVPDAFDVDSFMKGTMTTADMDTHKDAEYLKNL